MSDLIAEDRYRHRLQIAVAFLGVAVLALAWGSLLVLEVGYGTQICDPSTYRDAGQNAALRAWCTERAWTNLLPLCLLGAGLAVVAVPFAAARRSRLRWWGVALSAVVACSLVWVGFALPQVLAGA